MLLSFLRPSAPVARHDLSLGGLIHPARRVPAALRGGAVWLPRGRQAGPATETLPPPLRHPEDPPAAPAGRPGVAVPEVGRPERRHVAAGGALSLDLEPARLPGRVRARNAPRRASGRPTHASRAHAPATLALDVMRGIDDEPRRARDAHALTASPCPLAGRLRDAGHGHALGALRLLERHTGAPDDVHGLVLRTAGER